VEISVLPWDSCAPLAQGCVFFTFFLSFSEFHLLVANPEIAVPSDPIGFSFKP